MVASPDIVCTWIASASASVSQGAALLLMTLDLVFTVIAVAGCMMGCLWVDVKEKK